MRLRALRESRHENQEKLARIINVSQTMISRYELGQASPDIATLIQLAKHYQVSVDYLVGNSDAKLLCAQTDLSDAEQHLLAVYRSLEDPQRSKAEAYLQGLLDG